MQTKVKIRLSCLTDYLEYRQKTKNVFRYKNKVSVTLPSLFLQTKGKGNPLEKLFFNI